MLEKFENEAFFLWLGLSTTLIRHENGASFSKPLVKPNQSENAGFLFSELSGNDDVTIILRFSCSSIFSSD